ncbi:MAG: hypothetical protein Q7W55_01920 [Pseudohongiella sp.]|nr:hypothetical protein [Pseudohongiella sp.]
MLPPPQVSNPGHRFLIAAGLLLSLAACSDAGDTPPAVSATAGTASGTASSPAGQFMAAFQQHCGLAYAGRIAVNQPTNPNDAFAGQTLIMHVRECHDGELRIPFHVGDDHSRTWIVTQTGEGLRLKHDHRHEDGSEDVLTQYGGDTTTAGTAVRQEFPVDQFSIDLFMRDGSAASVTNVWAMEIVPGEQFVYELARTDSDRLFRVEFDLTTPVATPPTPWGHDPL